MQFRITVNEAPENVVLLMESHYKIYKRSAKTYFILGNIVEIYHNEDYDEFLSKGENGWFYYKTHMDFFPTMESITVAQEIEIAENIKKFFDNCLLKSEIIFESDEYQS